MHPIAKTSKAGLPLLARVRKIAMALPEATAMLNHGRPCFSVRDKTFVMFLDNHHGDGRIAIWCKAPPGDQGDMVEADPRRFFVPPYVGPRGWIGVRLAQRLSPNSRFARACGTDRGAPRPDWKLVTAIIAESYRMTAPKRLLASRA